MYTPLMLYTLLNFITCFQSHVYQLFIIISCYVSHRNLVRAEKIKYNSRVASIVSHSQLYGDKSQLAVV